MAAALSLPVDLAFDLQGRLYVADLANSSVRVIADTYCDSAGHKATSDAGQGGAKISCHCMEHTMPAGVTTVTGTQGKVTLYPNPVTRQLLIDAATPVDIEVYTAIGAKVLSASQTNKVDVSGLPSGWYIVKITTADGALLQVERVLKADQ
ncbi:MAG: T9SS C-terminal target domain-containing protein [Chitinophagia bacterium]|nr:T9SS C-terminal target domain-containing protein [Chitinophagia bacterium]